MLELQIVTMSAPHYQMQCDLKWGLFKGCSALKSYYHVELDMIMHSCFDNCKEKSCRMFYLYQSNLKTLFQFLVQPFCPWWGLYLHYSLLQKRQGWRLEPPPNKQNKPFQYWLATLTNDLINIRPSLSLLLKIMKILYHIII